MACPAHTPDAYPCSRLIPARYWSCSSWIQMTSEQCGWRIPGAYPVFSRDGLGRPMGSRPQRIPLTHTLAPNGIWRDPGWIQMTSEECGWRIPSAYPFFSRGVLGSLIGSRPQRIPLTHTLAPHGVGRILAMFQLHPDDERGMWLAHTRRTPTLKEECPRQPMGA